MELNFDNLFEFNIQSINENSGFKEKIKQFCRINQIFGGSFAILSKRYNRPFLLFAKEVKTYYNIDPEVDFYEYLNTPYDSIYENKQVNNKYFIDVLFHSFRMKGKPEYITNIDDTSTNEFEYPFQTLLRKEKKILHCSSGEILFFLVVWRILIKKILNENRINNILDFFKEQKMSFPVESKLYEIAERKTNNINSDIQQGINDNIESLEHLKENNYLTDLGIIENSVLKSEFFRYLKYLNLDVTSDIKSFDEDIFIKKVFNYFKIENDSSGLILLNKIHDKARFPLLPYYFLYKHDKENRRKDHFVMPVWWVYSDSTKYSYKLDSEEISVDHVLHCLYTLNPLKNDENWYTVKNEDKESLPSLENKELSEEFKKYLFNLVYFLKSFVNPIIDKEYYSKVRDLDIIELKKNSLKTSLAAVMARNMSHNIGSHVLNRMSDKTTVDEFFAIAKNSLGFTKEQKYTPKEIYELSSYFPKNTKNSIRSKFDTPNELSRVFNDYLKKRMDFVADVATSDYAALSSNKYLFSDIFRNFERNLILLQNISGKEEYFTYKFAFEYYDGSSTYTKSNEIGNGFQDPIIAIPNDVLGDQAFYILLENIIRNTAKHSGATQQVTFTIKVEDIIDDFFRITVYDDVKKDTADEITNLIYNRNVNIKKPVLDENTNEIRFEGWGTIELKIAACYLRGVQLTDIDDPKYAPVGLSKYERFTSNHLQQWREFMKKECTDYIVTDNCTECPKHLHRKIVINSIEEVHYPILQAVNGSEDDKSGFGYSFLMKKPKEILIYDPKGQIEQLLSNDDSYKQTISILKKLGVDIINELPKESKLFTHNYFLALDDEDNDLSVNTALPQEQYKFNDGKLTYYSFKTKKKHSETSFDLKGKILDCINDKYSFPITKVFNKLYFLSLDKIIAPQIHGENEFSISDLEINRELLTDFFDIKKPITIDNAVFSHHGMPKYKFQSNVYAEIFGSSTKLGFYVNSIKEKIKTNNNLEKINQKNSVAYFLWQGANTNIIVVDERVQKLLSDPAYQVEEGTKEGNEYPGYSLTYAEIFEKTGISIPPSKKIINLNATKLSDFYQNFVDYISKETELAHYLIVHFGILEAFRTDNRKLEDVANEIKNICEKNKCKLVLTSGRGFTPDIRALNEYFVSYSAISNLLLEPNNRSKPHLVKLLNSLRK
ncbi:MAG: hypothetical protein JJE44_02125 [Flavobacteriaceae bacterium]|nr:hypothetical protein [Flavobacteriaceae bacterium]